MGLFDWFSNKKSDGPGDRAPGQKDFARWARLASNKMAQDYDRQDAIAQLSRLKSEEAARALLKRFDFAMDPSLVDQDEKEAAAEGIVAAGEAALPAIRAYCARADSLTWAIKVLRRIVPEGAVSGELVALIRQFDTEYLRNPEPKVQLIGMLAEHRGDEVRGAIEPFLTDVNEGVRFAAATAVFQHDDRSSAVSVYAALLAEESLRIRNLIARGLHRTGWPLPSDDLREACARALPQGFALQGNQVHATS